MACWRSCSSFFTSLSPLCVITTLLLIYILSFVLSLIVLIAVKWKYHSKTSLILVILIFVLSIILILFSSLILYWRKKSSEAASKKQCVIVISITGIVLSVIIFILCIIGDTTFSNDFKDRCNLGLSNVFKNDFFNCDESALRNIILEKAVSYLCFTYTELVMIVSFVLWYSTIKRIKNGLDPEFTPEEYANIFTTAQNQQQNVGQYQTQQIQVQQTQTQQNQTQTFQKPQNQTQQVQPQYVNQVQPQYVFVQGNQNPLYYTRGYGLQQNLNMSTNIFGDRYNNNNVQFAQVVQPQYIQGTTSGRIMQ